MKNILILPDGTEITSGPQTTNALTWVEETESVNIGEDLVIGSAYANKLKARILTPYGGLNVNAGDEITLVKEDNGTRTQCGIYVMEKPERSSAHSTQLTGYDRVIKLDKDLTEWLNGLTGWPYRLIDFAAMVCQACGLRLVTTSVPNADFPVPQFSKAGVTGRQLMRWIGEICCRFCRANADGNIEFAWYEPSGKSITPTGETRYLANTLTYDTYQVAPVDAVQLRLAESSDGALWPSGSRVYGTLTGNDTLNIRTDAGVGNAIVGQLVRGERVQIFDQNTVAGQVWGRIYDGWVCITGYLTLSETEPKNPYAISGNAILLASVTEDLLPYLYNIEKELYRFTYTPCKVAIMATQDIRAGHIVDVTDINGHTIKTVVMTKTSKGFRNTLECTGNPNRESANAVNNKTPSQVAQDAVNQQTHEDIFNKLTKNGKIKGFFVDDDILVINADFAKIINIVADAITSGILKSKDGKTQVNLDTGEISVVGDLGRMYFNLGSLQLTDPNGVLKAEVGMSISEYSLDDTPEILLYPRGEDGPHYGFSAATDGLWMYAPYEDAPGGFVGRKIGFKTIGEEEVLAVLE